MKKVLIAVAALIAALAVALLVMSLTAPKAEKLESGDAESLYAYYYEKTKTDLCLKITGDFPEGSSWKAVGGGSSVEPEAQEQTQNSASFLLKPVAPGEEILRFDLQREADGMTENLYEIEVTVQVTVSNTVSIRSNTHRILQGIVAGEDEGFSYRVTAKEDGSLLVKLEDNGAHNWQLVVEGSSVSAVLAQEKTGCSVQIDYAALGQSTVWLVQEGSDHALKLYVSTNLLEEVTLVTHEGALYVPGEGPDPDRENYVRAYGKMTLPAGVFGQKESVVEVETAQGMRNVGCVGFSMGGRYWQLLVAEGMTEAELANREVGTAAEVVQVQNTNVSLWQQEGGGLAGWTADGRTYLLTGREAGIEELRAVLGGIMTAVNHG